MGIGRKGRTPAAYKGQGRAGTRAGRPERDRTSRTLSTHWARHTWASIGKQNNLPVRVISECLGHTSEKTTRIYLDLLDNKLLDAANETVLSAIPKLPRRTALALRI